MERASSMPSSWGGGGCSRRGQGGGPEKPLPRAMCFPVAIGRGAYDVTPRLVSYFEVTISSPRVDPPNAIPDCVAIGLSEGSFPLQGKMPGWDSASYGYHSDDGGAFHDAGSMLFKCGPSFGPGDVVGCGLDYSVGDDCADIFFTLNGRSLGAAFRGVRGSFYPTVGIDSACPVRINFGTEPFVFDLASSLREGGQEASARESVVHSNPPEESGDNMKKPRSKSYGGRGGGGENDLEPALKGPDAIDSRQRQQSLPLPSMFRSFGGGGAPPTGEVALSY